MYTLCAHLLTQNVTVSPCFQRILYCHSRFCRTLCAHLLAQYFLRHAYLLSQYFTISPCFQRILYRQSKFCGALHAHLLTQYCTVSPCFQRILYCHSKFCGARNTIFYWFKTVTSLLSHMFNSVQGRHRQWRHRHTQWAQCLSHTWRFCVDVFIHTIKVKFVLRKYAPISDLRVYVTAQTWMYPGYRASILVIL